MIVAMPAKAGTWSNTVILELYSLQTVSDALPNIRDEPENNHYAIMDELNGLKNDPAELQNFQNKVEVMTTKLRVSRSISTDLGTGLIRCRAVSTKIRSLE